MDEKTTKIFIQLEFINFFLFPDTEDFFLNITKQRRGGKSMHEKLVLGAIKNYKKHAAALSPLSRIS